MKPELIIFDLDGTICVSPEFYRDVYSGTLNEVVEKERGNEGLKVLQYCREHYAGKGEFALFALNISFAKWAEYLNKASLSLISPQHDLVSMLRGIEAKKVIYTGSPIEMACKVVSRLGFSTGDFDDILGWEKPETFPIKWTCSSVMFELIADRFSINPEKAWSVGDSWETDLFPAHLIGMKTFKTGKLDGNPDVHISDIQKLCDFI